MSSINDCCSPCSTVVPPVQVPGIPGADGADGAPGLNAFTTVTDVAGFVVPDIGNTVGINVLSSLWMVVGMIVVVGTGVGGAVTGPATFQVTAMPTPTTATLRFLGYGGDVAPGTTIANGALVSAGTSLLKAARTLSNQTGGVGNTADTNEDDLMTYLLPANRLNANGDLLKIEAVFTCAANADTKQVKLYFGATAVLTVAAVAQNGGVMVVEATVVRTGVAAQLSWAWAIKTDGAGTTTSQAGTTSPGATLSGTITIKATGKSGTATASNISQNSLVVQYWPA